MKNKKNYGYLWVSLVYFFILLFSITPGYAAVGSGVLVVDRSIDNAITKLSSDGKDVLFSMKGSIPASDVEVDSRDGTIWVTYKTSSTLVKYSADGKDKLLEIKKSFCTPRHSALDIKENVIWIASWTQGELIKYSLDGRQLLRIQNLGNIYEVLISPFDNTIWVGDQKINKFINFSSDGKMLGFSQRRLGTPLNLSIDSKDGSLWATFYGLSGKLAKFSHQGNFIFLVDGLTSPQEITIDPQDNSVWVTDAALGELVHISSEGKIVKRIGGFKNCSGLSAVDVTAKAFWMANTGNGEIIKFSTTGEILDRVKVDGNPSTLVAYTKNK